MNVCARVQQGLKPPQPPKPLQPPKPCVIKQGLKPKLQSVLDLCVAPAVVLGLLVALMTMPVVAQDIQAVTLVVVAPVDAVSLLLVAVSHLSVAEVAAVEAMAMATPLAAGGEGVLAVVVVVAVVLLGRQPAPLVLEPEILPKTKTSLVTPAPNLRKNKARSRLLLTPLLKEKMPPLLMMS